jgi:hypothetical protein
VSSAFKKTLDMRMLVSPWRIIRSESECGMFSFGSLISSNGWVRLVCGVFVALFMASGPVRAVVMEDWMRDTIARKGIPSGWTGESFGGRALYDFTIEQDAGRRVLHLASRNERSTISRDITGKVNLQETPILEWTWKATGLPTGGDLRRKETTDRPRGLCRMAAISYTASIQDYRLCRGHDNDGHHRKVRRPVRSPRGITVGVSRLRK